MFHEKRFNKEVKQEKENKNKSSQEATGSWLPSASHLVQITGPTTAAQTMAVPSGGQKGSNQGTRALAKLQ